MPQDEEEVDKEETLPLQEQVDIASTTLEILSS